MAKGLRLDGLWGLYMIMRSFAMNEKLYGGVSCRGHAKCCLDDTGVDEVYILHTVWQAHHDLACM